MLQIFISRIEDNAALRAQIEDVLAFAQIRENWYDPAQAPTVPGDNPSHVVWLWRYRCVFSITLVHEGGAGSTILEHLQGPVEADVEGNVPCRMLSVSLPYIEDREDPLPKVEPRMFEVEQILELFHFSRERTRAGLNQEPDGQEDFMAWEPYLSPGSIPVEAG